jgi:mono/diheme cytochrome c family protein
LRPSSLLLLLAAVALTGCPEPPIPEPDPLWPYGDDPVEYVENVRYGRAVLVRDLTTHDNAYAARRLAVYGIEGEGWSALPERDLPSRPLTDADVTAMHAGEPLPEGASLETLTPQALPTAVDDWVALGRRVFFEYPLREDGTYTALLSIDDGLPQAGFLRDGDSWVGLRVFENEDGDLAVGNTCAQCHASEDPRTGGLSATLANRWMNIGAARLLVEGLTPGDLPPELDSTTQGDWDRLGPGRSDVLSDGIFNPFAFPDMGGLADLPFLHHNANWYHRGTATLAVRCETLFTTANGERSRIPRVLAWALAEYYRSLPPPPPLADEPSALADDGEALFLDSACVACHPPPLYTSDREVSVGEIGTNPDAGDSFARGSGLYRIPSLRGVGRTAPYLHHGAFPTLQEMFDPDREEPGHEYGLDWSPADREALIAFLNTI